MFSSLSRFRVDGRRLFKYASCKVRIFCKNRAKNIIRCVFFVKTELKILYMCIVYFQQAFSGSCLQVQKSDGYEPYFSENTEGTYGE